VPTGNFEVGFTKVQAFEGEENVRVNPQRNREACPQRRKTEGQPKEGFKSGV